MILCVCLDDRGGMRFNRRRQSRDRAVCERILALVRECGGTLYVCAESRMLFADEAAVLPEPCDFSLLCENDFFFAEDPSVLPPRGAVGRLIVYRWNRTYPFDRRFPTENFLPTLLEKTDFVGHSHEKITEEVYTR